ncbi:MAG: oligopeptide/dipeptide ABC transporter ATP-binding protein [Acetobacteraceae bacterium]
MRPGGGALCRPSDGIRAVATLFTRPAHAYTLGLLRSLPGSAHARQRLQGIAGTPPDPAAMPPGCRFAPRCSFAVEACRIDDKLLQPVRPGSSAPASAPTP